MGVSQTTGQQLSDYLYRYAANLLASGTKGGAEVARLLMLKGLAADEASAIVSKLESPIQDARKAQAKKDMLHGGLWCVSSLALTLADVGFVFWVPLCLGVSSLVKGVTNSK